MSLWVSASVFKALDRWFISLNTKSCERTALSATATRGYRFICLLIFFVCSFRHGVCFGFCLSLSFSSQHSRWSAFFCRRRETTASARSLPLVLCWFAWILYMWSYWRPCLLCPGLLNRNREHNSNARLEEVRPASNPHFEKKHTIWMF